MQFREFDAKRVLSKLNIRPVATLQDYKVLTPDLARVIINLSAATVGNEFNEAVARLFDGHATVVPNSFRRLSDLASVGYISTNREVREYSNDDGRYRAIAANILMDQEDQSTWEMREGASGKYLARQGEENLSELAGNIYERRVGVPTFAAVAFVAPKKKAFLAFVDPKEKELDYGFVVEASDNQYAVVSHSTGGVANVSKDLVVHIAEFDDSEHKEGGMPEMASGLDKAGMIEYYRKAYEFAPDYVAKIVEQINGMAIA